MPDPSRHLILAGDSIFDNDSYVPGEPGVIEQLRMSLPRDWSATKVAIDGDCLAHVPAQLDDLPSHVTDIFVSAGVNDERQYVSLLEDVSVPQYFAIVSTQPLASFRSVYREMLSSVQALGLRVSVCTIYTAIPFDDLALRTYAPLAIDGFNKVILEEASEAGLFAIRLDLICDDPQDYSAMSPIEPSAAGGKKIVSAILDAAARN